MTCGRDTRALDLEDLVIEMLHFLKLTVQYGEERGAFFSGVQKAFVCTSHTKRYFTTR